MIIYCTSVSQSMSEIIAYARMLVLEKGSGMARLAMPGPYLNPNEQLQAAEDILADNANGGIVIVASSYELPILRILKRIGQQRLDASQFKVHCITNRNESVRKQVHELRVDNTGEFIDMWPEGFFGERMSELFY